jgi:hypothetical protein
MIHDIRLSTDFSRLQGECCEFEDHLFWKRRALAPLKRGQSQTNMLFIAVEKKRHARAMQLLELQE